MKYPILHKVTCDLSHSILFSERRELPDRLGKLLDRATRHVISFEENFQPNQSADCHLPILADLLRAPGLELYASKESIEHAKKAFFNR